MGAHQYGCAVYQLPSAHPQMEKAESAWLGMPRHSNTACRLPENTKSSLHIGKPKCRLLFKENKMLKPIKRLKIILAATLLPAAALWLYAGYLKKATRCRQEFCTKISMRWKPWAIFRAIGLRCWMPKNLPRIRKRTAMCAAIIAAMTGWCFLTSRTP